jgi:6,7-dimethyl-8-ribityllumazine synthase
MSKKSPRSVKALNAGKLRIAVIASRFNQEIVDELLSRCLARLDKLGVKRGKTAVHRVPGAFEIPLAAKWAAQTGKFNAVICLGAVVRGETPHFDFVAGEAARGIQNVALETGVPVMFGILTTDNDEQARARFDVGTRMAEGAVEMAALARAM